MEEVVEEPALWAAAILFGVTYLAIVSERIPKTAVALVGGAAMILFGIISQEAAFESIDFNVIFLLVGMMVIANITGKTGPIRVAGHTVSQVSSGKCSCYSLSTLLHHCRSLSFFGQRDHGGVCWPRSRFTWPARSN